MLDHIYIQESLKDLHVFQLLLQEDVFSREVLLEQAEKYQVCPFEMSLDVASVDDIICDYNYVFDPSARLKRYFSDGVSGEYLFLIDEAHNLVPRAREMYSAAVCEGGSSFSKKILKGLPGAAKTVSLLDACNKRMLELKRAYGTGKEEEGISHRRVLGADYELLGDVKLLALELDGHVWRAGSFYE